MIVLQLVHGMYILITLPANDPDVDIEFSLAVSLKLLCIGSIPTDTWLHNNAHISVISITGYVEGNTGDFP